MPFSPLVYSSNHHLHVWNRLAIHHQAVALLYLQLMVFIMHLRWLTSNTTIPYAAHTLKYLLMMNY